MDEATAYKIMLKHPVFPGERKMQEKILYLQDWKTLKAPSGPVPIEMAMDARVYRVAMRLYNQARTIFGSSGFNDAELRLLNSAMQSNEVLDEDACVVLEANNLLDKKGRIIIDARKPSGIRPTLLRTIDDLFPQA